MDSAGTGDIFESGFPHNLTEIHGTWYERCAIGVHANPVFVYKLQGMKSIYRTRERVILERNKR